MTQTLGSEIAADSLLDIAEVAKRLGLSTSTLRGWRYEDKGPLSAKFGRRIVYRESDVDAWIAGQFAHGRGDQAKAAG